jgi:hypothetical protein
MAGYSGTPLPKKLGIKDSSRFALVNPPRGFDRTLGTLPAGASCLSLDAEPLDVIVFFATRREELESRFRQLSEALTPAGGLWVAWPKRASGVPTDLTENVVRDVALAAGMVDNKVCAVDDVWSGLRLVVRIADRPARMRRATDTRLTPNAVR